MSVWIQSLLGWGILLASIGLFVTAWWALFGDRARGRRRCPRCWFDLSHTEGLTCGECGYTGRSERDLQRKRPRPKLAVLAILGCAMVSTYGIERVMTRGWASYVPTPIATRLLPVIGSNRSVVDELIRRIGLGQLSEDTCRALLDRVVRGDAFVTPPSPAWRAKYGRMTGPLVQSLGAANLAACRETLLRLPVDVQLDARRFWPIDVGPTVDVTVHHLWPSVSGMAMDPQARVRIEGVVEGPGGPFSCAPDVHGLHRGAIQSRSYSYRLPPLPRGTYTARLRITSEQRLEDDDPWRADGGSREVTLPIRVERPIDAFLEPIAGAELDAALQRVFSAGLVRYASGSLPVRINLGRQSTATAAFDDVAIGIHVEVFRDGVKGRELDTWWLGGQAGGQNGTAGAWEVPFVDDAVLLQPLAPGEVWTMRVTGVPELALRVEGARRYWSGSIEFAVPIGGAGTREAPPRGWIEADDPALSPGSG